MFVAVPLPYYPAVPVYLQNAIVKQELVTDFRIFYIAVAQDQSIPAVYQRHLSGRIIADRIAFPLEVMMISGHPSGRLTGIFYILIFTKLPDNIAFPINLQQFRTILKTKLHAPVKTMTENVAAGQHFIGETTQFVP